MIEEGLVVRSNQDCVSSHSTKLVRMLSDSYFPAAASQKPAAASSLNGWWSALTKRSSTNLSLSLFLLNPRSFHLPSTPPPPYFSVSLPLLEISYWFTKKGPCGVFDDGIE